MSRTGVEAKPLWREVPEGVRQQVGNELGAAVVRAVRVWGGYAPTPTYRLVLADGRRAFFKGTFEESNPFMKNALTYEERVYNDLSPILQNFMPQLYSAFRYEDWHCLVLEDVGPKSVPPWTPHKARTITHAVASFHQTTLGAAFPEWLAHPAKYFAGESWTKTAQDSENFQKIADMLGEKSAQALEWFQNVSPDIERLLTQADLSAEPHAILHGDLRSDNMRFSKGRLSLFDWPAVTRGRAEWDIVPFAQSVAVEGGPPPEQILKWYKEKASLDNDAVESALAWCLTFFADRAWREEIPGLPRLRRFQRQQLGILILWVSRHLSMTTPQWAELLLV